MSSDGSEVWSIESKKTDEQVELEIISQIQKKLKYRLPFPTITQSKTFKVKLKDARFKRGEIVWFSMDRYNWPCVVLACWPVDDYGAQYNKSLGNQKNVNHVNVAAKINVQKNEIWKIWPGASIFKRNIFGRKVLKYMKNSKVSDRVNHDSSQESSDHYSDQDGLDEEISQDVKKRKIHQNYRNQYDLIPLPLSVQVLKDLWSSNVINEDSKMEKVDENHVKPWLHKDLFPIPSNDINRNLSILQAIHTSCSWAIPEEYLTKLKKMEENALSSFINISLQYFRHGTEVISVGDLVRLVTNLRQTRNVTSNQTTLVLYVASLNLVSQLSQYQDSKETYWDHEIILYGSVYEPRGSGCVSTGEYRTVTTSGICGRWYSSFLNINRKMPAIEESSLVL